ncbi:MAG: hypothetical protein DRJ52_02725 [Thermoprotei archaeon]|nr:MAG: hypothetical protein DRJ52_02725 [Thermoprotei archaeon]RLE99874.1 MAG: hypothetical protein DRJ63_04055 [Thermoprotei archaeon]HDI74711.1 hypothetical protein [Thermoprotei archaeon]
MKLVLRNSDIKRILMGCPRGHKHIRLVIETEDLTIVFQEATVANIVRAYVTLKTHPTRRAVELQLTRLEKLKEGYAEYQLLEVEKEDREIEKEIYDLLYSNPSC